MREIKRMGSPPRRQTTKMIFSDFGRGAPDAKYSINSKDFVLKSSRKSREK